MLTIKPSFTEEARSVVSIAIARGWAKLPRPTSVDPVLLARREQSRECMRKLHAKRIAAGLTIYGTKRKAKR